MKKGLITLLLIAVMVASMVACGKNSSDGNTGDDKTEQNVGKDEGTDVKTEQGSQDDAEKAIEPYEPTYGDVEIDFWYSQGDMYTQQLVDQYMAEHPNVKINTLQLGFWDVGQKLTPALAGGTGPDIFQGEDITSATKYATRQQIVNIDDAMAARGFDETQYLDKAVEVCKYEDELYGLPWMTDVRILYYNKDHFIEAGLDPEQPPKTWAEMKDYAEKLTILKDGQIERLGFHTGTGNCFPFPVIWTNGGTLIKGEEPQFTSQENINALQTALDIQNVVGGYDAYLTYGEGASANTVDVFCTGDVSMMISVDNYVDNILQYAPDMNWGAAVIPTNDGVNNHYTWSAGFALFFTDNGEDRLNAAIDFGKWMEEKEQMLFMATNTANLVCHNEAFNEGLDSKADKLPESYIAAVRESFDYARYNDVCIAYPDYTTAMQAAWNYALSDLKTPEKALQDAQDIVIEEIKNYHLIND